MSIHAPNISESTDGVLQDSHDWQAVLARHVLDLRPALTTQEVLRLRMVSRSLRGAFLHLVHLVHVPWPTPALPSPPSQTPTATPALTGLRPGIPPLESARVAFPHATKIHLHLDLLALVSEWPCLETPWSHLTAATTVAAAVATPPAPAPAPAPAEDAGAAGGPSRVSQSGVGGADGRGAGSHGGDGGTVGDDLWRTVEAVRISARLPLRLVWGGRVLSAAEQQRLEQLFKALTMRLLQPLQPQQLPTIPGPNHSSSGALGPLLAEVTTHSTSNSTHLGPVTQAPGPGPPAAPQCAFLTAPLSLPPRLTRLQLELGAGEGGQGELYGRLVPPPGPLTAALLRLPLLQELSLSWHRIEGGHLAAVVAMSGLRALSLADAYDGPDGWLGACRAAVSLALTSSTGAALDEVSSADALGASGPAAAAAAAREASRSAARFAASFSLPPRELLPVDWHPGLLVWPVWLPTVRQLRLRSPSLAIHGQPPPWLVELRPESPPLQRGLAPPPPQLQEYFHEQLGCGSTSTCVPCPSSRPYFPLLLFPPSHAAAASALPCPAPSLPATPLASLTRLEVGGARPPRWGHWHQRGPRSSGHVREEVGVGSLLTSLAEHAQRAEAAAAAAAATATAVRVPHGLDPLSPRLSPQIAVASLPLLPPPSSLSGPTGFRSLTVLSFQSERLTGADWEALRVLGGLEELRINGWTPGEGLSPCVLQEVEEVDLEARAGEVRDGVTVAERQWRAAGEEEESGVVQGMELGCGVASAGGSSGGGRRLGLLSLPRLRVLMLSLRSAAQLRRLVGGLPQLEVLHLAIKGGAEEGAPCQDEDTQAVQAAAAAVTNKEAALRAWRPLLDCRRLVEVNVLSQRAVEMPLRGDMVAAHLTSAWPRLVVLQYSAGGWSGLDRTGVEALGRVPVGSGRTARGTVHGAAAVTAGLREAAAPLERSSDGGRHKGTTAGDISSAIAAHSPATAAVAAAAASPAQKATTAPPFTSLVQPGQGAGAAAASAIGGAIGGGDEGLQGLQMATGPEAPISSRWRCLQVLSLGSGPPSRTGGWTAPQPLFLDELPGGLRALSLNGLQLRWGPRRCISSSSRSGMWNAARSRREIGAESPQPLQLRRGLPSAAPYAGPGLAAGGGQQAATGCKLFPQSLKLLSLKFCRWQVLGVSLLGAVSRCTSLLELKLTWPEDDPPYIVRRSRHRSASISAEHQRSCQVAGAGRGGGDFPYPSPAPNTSLLHSGPPGASDCGEEYDGDGDEEDKSDDHDDDEEEEEEEEREVEGDGDEAEGQQWAKLAEELIWLERLELNRWATELPLGRRGGGQVGEEGDEGLLVGAAEGARQQQMPEGEGRGEGEVSAGAAAVRAVAADGPMGMAQLVRGVARMRRLHSLKLEDRASGPWGDEVDWSALSQMTALVQLELSGVTRGTASRVLQLARSSLPSCRPLVHVDNEGDMRAEMRRIDLLLGTVAPAAASVESGPSSTSASSLSPPGAGGSGHPGLPAGPGDAAPSAGFSVSDDGMGSVDLSEDVEAELLEELQRLELQLEAEGQAG